MGYSTIFKLKNEIDDRFKSNFSLKIGDYEIEKQKSILLATCMLEDNSIDIRHAYDKIHSELHAYISYIENQWKQMMSNIKNNEYYFYGWEYSRGKVINTWESIEEITSWFMIQIYLISVTPCESLIKDSEEYYSKLENIEENVNYIEVVVKSFLNKEFINFYRDSDLAEEDGDDTPENNEKKTDTSSKQKETTNPAC